MRVLLSIVLMFCLEANASHKNYKTRHHKHRHGLGFKNKVGVSGRPVDFFQDYKKVTLPDSVDLRSTPEGLSPIQNQGQAGTCWAFSQTASLQDTWRLAGKDPGALSQEYLVHAAAPLGEGCNGGYFDAFQYLVFPKGSPSASRYPYSDKDCSGSVRVSKPVMASGAKMVMIVPSHYNLMYVLSVLKRPLSVTVAAGMGEWQDYDGGIYDGCRAGGQDHMINLVGMQRNGSAFNNRGMLPKGKGVAILRNSWGEEWGESGYMRTKLTEPRAGIACNMVATQAGYVDITGISPPPASVVLEQRSWWRRLLGL